MIRTKAAAEIPLRCYSFHVRFLSWYIDLSEGGGEPFPRVHWAAVPEASRARRANANPKPQVASLALLNAPHPSVLLEMLRHDRAQVSSRL
eukprot:COSAG01_NODE_5377_length_4298_cov_2.455347_4_plen_91_part_00